jgi:hypothetical protein
MAEFFGHQQVNIITGDYLGIPEPASWATCLAQPLDVDHPDGLVASGEKCKLLAGVVRAPPAGQQQHLFLYFLPEIDKDAMHLLSPYTFDALDVYALMRIMKEIVPASHGLLRMSPKHSYSLKVV